MSGRHAGPPEPQPWEIYVSFAIAALIFGAIAAYLITSVHW